MKLDYSKKWYLHLIYYRLLKLYRFFKNIFFARKDHIFLFILSPPFCGSTLLNQILSTSKNLSCNNYLGVREGQLLPEVKDIMFNNKGWDNHVSYPWSKIKRVWMEYWDQSKQILMDKSTTNIMRVQEIKDVFTNISFLAMVRNPYAQVEGIIRRNNSTAEYAAKFALKCLRYQRRNKEHYKDILFFSYEDLCDNTEEVFEKIQKYIPELGKIKSNLKFSAHNYKTKNKMRIQNLNKEKIAMLSTEQLLVINSYFKMEAELLDYFGYSIIF